MMKLNEWIENKPKNCKKQVIVQIDKFMYSLKDVNPYVYDIIDIENYQTYIVLNVKRDFKCAFDE